MPVVVSPAERDWGLEIAIQPTDALRVRLANASRRPISIIWEECAYIDIDNRSHPVQASYAQQVAGQRRSTLAPGTTLEEVLVPLPGPRDNPLDPLLSSKRPRGFHVWRRGKAPSRLGALVRRDHPLMGQQLGVFLVFEREGQRKTVLAKYTITGDARASATKQ